MATSIEELAKKFGGAPVTNYEDLAKKFGGSLVTDQEPAPTQRRPAYLEGTDEIRPVTSRAWTKKKTPDVEAPPKLSFSDVVQNDKLFDVASNYLRASGNAPKKDEAREDVVNRFLAEQRFARFNTTFGAVPELSRLVNATPEVKKGIAEGRDLYDKMASAYEEGGQGGFKPVRDVVKAVAADIPLFLGTGAVGAVAGKSALTALTKAATPVAASRAAAAGIGVMEGGLGVAQETTAQRTAQETQRVFGEEPDPLDATRIAAVGLFSAAIGAGVPLVAGKLNRAKVDQQGEALARAIANEKQKVVPTAPDAPMTPVEKALVDPLTENMDQVHDQYMKIYGKELLEMLDPSNALTDAKVRTDMAKAAIRVALRVVQLDDAFKLKPNEQISSALAKVFARLDTIDDVVLEKALNENGVTKQMFAAMSKSTLSEAASLMQEASVAAKAVERMANANPGFDKKIKDLYTYKDDQVDAFNSFDMALRGVREWKAIITSGVDVTARNIENTAYYIPMKSGIQLMEGFAYASGRAFSMAAKGQRAETFKRSMSDTIHETWSVYKYMLNSGVTREVVDNILKTNPNLRDNINNALQETGNRKLSAFTQWANSLNVVVDSFFRRAVFASTVEREIGRQGKNLYIDFLDKNADIPIPIIKQAMKEALQTTYSYVPKVDDATVVSPFERSAGTLASKMIKTIDSSAVLSLAIPFPRYMANAMGFLYRYSPAGFIGSRQEFKIAKKLMAEAEKTGDRALLEKAERIYRSAGEKGIQSIVGLGMLTAAYDYRKENPDKPWYEVDNNDGESIDVRGLGNAANYFALADVVMRINQGTYSGKNFKDAFESVVGLKYKAGGGDTYFDSWVKAFENEKWAKELFIQHGKFVGDVAGGFTQPFVAKQLVDLINLIRDEGRVIRDPNIVGEDTGFGAAAAGAARKVTDVLPFLSEGASETAVRTAANVGVAAEAATNRVMGRLPILKEQLPEAVIRLTPEEMSREGEFFNRLIGFRQTIQRSPLESEIVRLNLDPYELYGSSSGDRTYDRAYIRNANELVTKIVPNLLRSNNYRMLPDDEKLIRLSNAIKEQTSIAQAKTREEFKASDLERVYKMKFNKLPARIRRSINLRYAEDNNGVMLDEAKDWGRLDEYEALVRARTGSLSEQTNRAFGR
jgi:hypothetical protein